VVYNPIDLPHIVSFWLTASRVFVIPRQTWCARPPLHHKHAWQGEKPLRSPPLHPPSGKERSAPLTTDQMGVPAPYGIPAQPCAGWIRGRGICAPTPSTKGRISASAFALAWIRLPFGIPVA
jgi:hypothetical protein